jgi:single-strand DNA-binding protein
MANEPVITVVGNATADAELQFAPSGLAIARFTVAQTPRSMNKQTNQWEDGETIFMRVTVFGPPAENVAETVKKGYRLIVLGRMQMDRWEKDGEKREALGMIADEVGVALRFVSASVHRADRTPPAQQTGPDPWATAPAAGPGWATGATPPAAPPQAPQAPAAPPQQAPQPAQGGWGAAPPYEEPPFHSLPVTAGDERPSVE